MSCFYFFIFLPPAGLPIKTKEDKRSRLDDVGNLRGIAGVAAFIVEQPSPLLKIYPMEVHRKGNTLECIQTVCVKHVGWPSIRLCEQTSCLPPIILLFLTWPDGRSSAVTLPFIGVKQITMCGRDAFWTVDVIWTAERLERINMASLCADGCAVNFPLLEPIQSFLHCWNTFKKGQYNS